MLDGIICHRTLGTEFLCSCRGSNCPAWVGRDGAERGRCMDNDAGSTRNTAAKPKPIEPSTEEVAP